MIRKGRCFCPNCFSEFSADDAYFMQKITVANNGMNQDIPFIVGVKRKKGREVVVLKNPTDGYQVSDKRGIKREHNAFLFAPISGVDVTILRTSDKKQIDFVSDDTNRICPRCYDEYQKISSLPPNIGFYDSYLISMIGLRNVGKTVFAKSIATMRQELGVIFNDTVSGSHSENWYTSTATNKEKQSIGCYLHFQARKKNLYIMDTAGETYTYNQHENGMMNSAFQVKLNKYLSRFSDSMFLFLDERDMRDSKARWNPIFAVNPQEETVTTDKDEKIINITGNVISRNKGQYNPLTCILTKGDLFHAYIKEQDHSVLRDREGRPYITGNSPLFSSVSLDRGYSINTREGRQRMAVTLAEHMAGAYDFFSTAFDPQVAYAKDTPCFVISSGSQDEEKRMNFSNSCNVLFPLIHFLYNRL